MQHSLQNIRCLFADIDDTISTDGKVLQLDLNGGEADQTITFSVDAGFTFQLNSLVIGHASDQTGPANTWTLTLTEVGGSQVFSHTTIALGQRSCCLSAGSHKA